MANRERMVTKQFNPLYLHMFSDLLITGGSTYSFEGKKTSGIVVGGFSKTRHSIDAKNLTSKDLLWFTNVVRRVVEEYEHILSDHTYYVGTWLDKEAGILFIDICRVFATKEAAIIAGLGNDQKIVYNIDDGEYILLLKVAKDDDECHKQLYDEMGC